MASPRLQSENIFSRVWRRARMNPSLAWGCEISPAGVCLARWDDAGNGAGSAAWRPLEPGALEVSPLRENVLQPEAVRAALAGCLESLGQPASSSPPGRLRDCALAIPDQAARVFFLNFDEFPPRPAEAIPLIRWKLKKSVPFDIETSTVSYMARRHAEWEVLAVVSPEAIIRQYELLVESLGLKPRFVTLSTLAAMGLLPSSESESGTTAGQPAPSSCLLAKYSPPWLTTVIVYEGSVRLFRTVPIGDGAAAAGMPDGNEPRQILEAIHPSVAYFQDNFGKPLEQAFLCGLGEHTARIADALAGELDLPARSLWDEPNPPGSGWTRQDAERHFSALMGIARARRRV